MSRFDPRTFGADVRVLLLALAVAACACAESPAATYFVDAATGSDANSGTATSPFKSISRGLRVARSGDVVQVAPGTYGTATGEFFPLRVPEGVALLGDEDNKGAGITPTAIVGGGDVIRALNPTSWNATIDPRKGSTIAGFTITNDNNLIPAIPGYTRCGVLLAGDTHVTTGGVVPNDHVTIRNNTVTGVLHTAAISVNGGADGHVVTGNRIVDNVAGYGIYFWTGGIGSKLEENVITGNMYGVYFNAPVDLGGGPAGSAGGNVVSCNHNSDVTVLALDEHVWRTYPPDTIAAANGFWDHIPPVRCQITCSDQWPPVCQGGCNSCEICLTAHRAIELTTTGAQSAPNGCP